MSGVKGRSGGRRRNAGRPAYPADLHKLRGTWKEHRHGSQALSATALATVVAPAPVLGEIPSARLEPETAMWVRSVAMTWVLEPHHQKLLQLAGEAWDVAQAAGAQVAREGLTTPTAGGGVKAHPAVGIARAARQQFAALLSQLDLDEAPGPRR